MVAKWAAHLAARWAAVMVVKMVHSSAAWTAVHSADSMGGSWAESKDVLMAV